MGLTTTNLDQYKRQPPALETGNNVKNSRHRYWYDDLNCVFIRLSLLASVASFAVDSLYK
jgi:hypothetical protein